MTAHGSTIGILAAGYFFDANAFYAGLYRAVVNRCTAAGDSAMMKLVSPAAEQNGTRPAMAANHKADALIFIGEIDRRCLCTAVQSGLPFPLLDFYEEEPGAGCVLSENIGGGFMLTKRLLGAERKKAGLLAASALPLRLWAAALGTPRRCCVQGFTLMRPGRLRTVVRMASWFLWCCRQKGRRHLCATVT